MNTKIDKFNKKNIIPFLLFFLIITSCKEKVRLDSQSNRELFNQSTVLEKSIKSIKSDSTNVASFSSLLEKQLQDISQLKKSVENASQNAVPKEFTNGIINDVYQIVDLIYQSIKRFSHEEGDLLYSQSPSYTIMTATAFKLENKIDEIGQRRPYGMKNNFFISEEKTHISTKDLNNLLNFFENEINQCETELRELVTNNSKNLIALEQDKIKIDNTLEDRNFDVNEFSIQWGIPLFCSVAFLMYCVNAFSRYKTKKLTHVTDTNEYIQSMDNSVYIITVLLLILSLFILGLTQKIEMDALAALLGSVAGYVLNRNNQDPSKYYNVKGTQSDHKIPDLQSQTTEKLSNPSTPPEPPKQNGNNGPVHA